MTVRDATAADATDLVPLLAQLGYDVAPDALAARLAGATRVAGDAVLVACDGDGRIVGLGAFHIVPLIHRPGGLGRITALVVDERVRGRGVGKLLVDRFEALARAHRCERMEVTSNERR